MTDRESQLQEFFTTLSRIELDDLDAVEKAVSARRDYLIHVRLLSIPIGATVRWIWNGDDCSGLVIHHYRKSLLVLHEWTNGSPVAEGEEHSPEVNVAYEEIVWP